MVFFLDEEYDGPEPDIDVCQNCGRYFDWGSPARKDLIESKGLTDGAGLQRCYRCIAIDCE